MKSDSATPSLSGADSSVAQVTTPLEAKLPNGQKIFIRPEVLDPSGNVGVLDLDFESFRQSLSGLAEVIHSGLTHVKPTSAAVEFGLELGLSAGKLASILVDANSKATIKVTLTWSGTTDAS